VDSVAYGKLSLSDTLRRRFGITLYLFYLDRAAAPRPHVLAQYGGEEAHIGIPDGDLLAGTLPIEPLRKVRAWVELHGEALMHRWERAMQGQPVTKID
jgi:hypothetical protein